ncbi:hypothetical protein OMF39_17455, partial [Bordetella pertussis]
MFKRRLLQAALPLLLLSLGGFGAWLLSLPPAPAGQAGGSGRPAEQPRAEASQRAQQEGQCGLE